MYQSTSYVSRGSKTVMVTMAERSAQAARLLQEARMAQRARPEGWKRAPARWAVSRAGQVIKELGKRTAQVRAEARG